MQIESCKQPVFAFFANNANEEQLFLRFMQILRAPLRFSVFVWGAKGLPLHYFFKYNKKSTRHETISYSNAPCFGAKFIGAG